MMAQSRGGASLRGAQSGPGALCQQRVDVLWMPSIYRDLAELNQLALQLGEVAVFARVALRRALDKLEKVSQVFAFRGLEFGKLDAHAEGGTALGDNPGQDEPFYPDLSVSQPKTDFDAYAGRHGGGGLDEAPPNAGIG